MFHLGTGQQCPENSASQFQDVIDLHERKCTHKQDNHMELIILLEAHCHCALKCSNITLTGGSYKMFESGVCNRCWEVVETARPLSCPTLPPASLLAPSPSSFPLTLLSFPLFTLFLLGAKKKLQQQLTFAEDFPMPDLPHSFIQPSKQTILLSSPLQMRRLRLRKFNFPKVTQLTRDEANGQNLFGLRLQT